MKTHPLKIIFSILLFSGGFHIFISQNKNRTQIKEQSIDAYLEKIMLDKAIVGMGAAIIINEKVIWKKGFGYSDLEKEKPFTANTIMNIASISKTFTSVCIMKAVEEGKISLDEDINSYLPFKIINPNFPTEKITLRHIATHTSGLTDRSSFYGDHTYYNDKDSQEQLGDFLRNYFEVGGKYYSAGNFLKNKPGTYRKYSNIASVLAGYIVELKTNKKLNVYSKENIFKPLKMSDTGWFFSEINLPNHSKLYRKVDQQTNTIPLYGGTIYPDGGVRTSVSDLSKFFISLLNDGEYKNTRILSKKSVQDILTFQYTETNKPENVQLNNLNSGIFWATKMGAFRIGHNGSDPGMRTFMLSDLKKEIGVIVFFNTELGEKEEGIYFDIYEELYKHGQKLKKDKRL